MSRLRSPWLLAAVALAAAPATADWLVMKDGGRIETKGPWKVEGRRILFTQPNGTLSALRSDEVDLDQSATVTSAEAEAARKAAEPAPPPAAAERRTPVMTLTEKDIPPSPDAGGADEESTETEGQPSTPASDLSVASWEKLQNATADGVEIFGTIKNSGTNNITSPSVMVMIYGEDGGLLATNEGTINSGMLAPGQSANFRVAFPGVPDFSTVKFDVQGRGFRTNPAAGDEVDEEEAPPAAGDEAPPEEGGGA